MLKCPKCGTENRSNARFCNDCGYMLTDELRGNGTLGKGVILGKYNVLNINSFEVGETLYTVEERNEKDVKFIKEILTLLPEKKLQLKSIERFERDIEELTKISSPAFPAIRDYFVEKGNFYLGYYIVFDHVEGENLETILNFSKEILSEDFVAGLGWKICDTIEMLHNSKPPVFCFNLSPSNVLLKKSNNNIFLTDIPVSRPAQGGSVLPRRIEFVAPERFEGKIIPASDTYALGAMLHYLLTNIHSTPFIFKPIRSVRPELSVEMEEIISRSLRLKPEKRFEDAQSMKKTLEAKYGEPTSAVMPYLKGEKQKINVFEPAPKEKDIFAPQSYPVTVKPKPVSPKTIPETTKPRISIKEKFNEQPKEKPANEMINWYFQTGDKVSSSPIVVGDTLYVGSDDKCVYAIDIKDGREKWNFTTGSWVSTTPAFYKDKLYIGSRDGKIYCLNAFNGKKEWEFHREESIFFNPSIGEGILLIGSSLYEGGSYDEVLLTLDTETGNRKWTFKTDSSIFHQPFIMDNVVYFGTESGKIFALDLNTGEEIWKYDTGGRIYSSPVVFEDIVYITTEGLFRNGIIYLLSAEDGRYIWSIEFDKPFRSSVCVGDDIIYAPSLDKNIYAIDLSEKKILWKFETGEGIRCTPLLSEETVYIGSDDGCFYALNAKTGKKLWDVKTGGAVRSNPAIMGENIFFGSRDGKIYSLNLRKKIKKIAEEKIATPVVAGINKQNEMPENSLTDENLIKHASSLVEGKNYRKALEILEKAENPDVSVILLIADCYKELEETDRAIQSYEKASHISNSPEIYVNLGKAYSLKADFEAASLAYDMALELDDKCIDALLGKIQLLIIGKKYEEAILLVDKSEELTSDETYKKRLQNRRVKIFLDQGNDYLGRGEIATATNYFEKAEKLPLSETQKDILKKGKANIFFKLGEKYSEERNLELSVKFYKMCEEIYPDSQIASMAKKRRGFRE